MIKYDEKRVNVFKTICVKFIEDLHQVFPNEKDLLVAKFLLEKTIPIHSVLTIFLERVTPLKNKIKERDDRFFLEDNNIFSGLDNKDIIHFKRLWESDQLDEDDRKIIWNWIDKLVVTAEKCVL